jgi:hypothetical protein
VSRLGLIGWFAGAAALCLVSLCWWCSATFGLSQRGHVFAGTLTSPVSDKGLEEPSGVAVSEASGDVYVADQGNHRIVRLGPNDEFLSAWGYGVRNGADEYQVCESECKAGIAGKDEYQLGETVQAIAVDDCTNSNGASCTGSEDPSVGDVYVATGYATKKEEADEEQHETIDKFGPNGEELERVEKIKYEELGEKEETERLETKETDGIAVSARGAVWLYYEEKLFSVGDVQLGGRAKEPLETGFEEGVWRPGVAVAATGEFYIGHDGVGGGQKPPDVIAKEVLEEESATELEEVIGALDPENTTGLAVDESSRETDPSRGDVYLDVGDAIVAFDAHGAEVQRFAGEGEREAKGTLQHGGGVAVDAQADTVYAADAGTDRVDVYAPRVAAPPAVDQLYVREVSAESARLHAQIDTDGSAASYYFEYGPAPCAGEPSTCVRTVGSPASLPAAFGDQGVEAPLQQGGDAPVQAGTTYHYRVVVSDVHGTVASDEGLFTTLPAGAGEGLADARTWEMVSPPDKGGAGVELGLTFPSSSGGRLTEAAEDGRAVTYPTNGPVGAAQGSRSFEPTQMLSLRGSEGWSEAQDIVTPSEHAEGINFPYGSEYHFFSSNLALALVEPFNFASRTRLAEPPLSPPTSEAERGRQEKTLYVRADGPVAPQGEQQAALYNEARANGASMDNAGFVALVTGADVLPGAQFGSEQPTGRPLGFLSATPDLTHVVITSEVQGEHCQPGPLGCAPGLYEWSAGALKLISMLPNGEPAQAPQLGTGHQENEIVRHAISDDGSRVFWTSKSPVHLYTTDTASEPHQTLQLDEVQPGASGEGINEPVFQTASPDGAQAFFTDEQSLTPGAGATQGEADLYAYDTVSHTLTDLTPARETPTHELESADVQGLVLGAGEESCDAGHSGCDIYFVANGVLCERAGAGARACEDAQGEKASPGDCGTEAYAQTGCNLYVERDEAGGWGTPQFIARLSADDQPDFQAKFDGEGATELMPSARVSPDGRYLAFMSGRPLTGYDNRDAVTGEPDQEVFLYEASTEAEKPGRLVCVSCDPSGARPNGVLDLPLQESEAGAGLLVDRNGVWAGHRLAASLPDWPLDTPFITNYQPRYLSDSGRLYFDSPSDLAPQASNGTEDVYEYEPAGVPQGAHRCTSESAAYSQHGEGCIGLISSGTATGEAAFVDASASGGEGPRGEELHEGGGDVFFATTAKLVPQDVDDALDVYDAHECTGAEPCFGPPEEGSGAVCESGEQCRPLAYSPPASTTPATGSPSGLGNMPPKQGVSASTTVKPKPLTRTQELANALRSCRSRYPHARKKRAACERNARRRYRPAKEKAKKKQSAKTSGAGTAASDRRAGRRAR